MNEQQVQEEQDTIFKGVAIFRKQERNLIITRVLLYGIAAWWLVWGVIYGIRRYGLQASAYKYNLQMASFLMMEYVAIGMIFLALAICSHKKSTVAYLIAFIFYGIISFWFIYINSFHFQNDLVRIFILLLLVKGYEDAREYGQIKGSLGTNEA